MANYTLHRVFPLVSSLISVQWHDGVFWNSADTSNNDYSVPKELKFSDNFEYFHFHGTEDNTIPYDGKCPGPSFLGENVHVLSAQK